VRVEAARADTLSAAAIPNPSVGGSAAKGLPVSAGQCADPPCQAVSWSASVSDNGALFDSVFGKRSARRRVADAAWAAAKLNREDARRQLHFQLQAALVETARATLALEASVQVQQSLAHITELNRVRFSSCAISEADLAKVETESLTAEADVDRARLAVTQAKVSVAFLLGVRGPVPAFEIAPDLLSPHGPPGTEGLNVEALVAKALARRPDLLAAGVQRERAEASVELAQRSVLPDIQLAPSVSVLGPGTFAGSPPVVGLGAQVSVPLFYRFEGEQAHARADREAQRLGEDKVRAQVVADVQSAWAAFSSAQRRLGRMTGVLLERAKRTRDLVDLQYRKGAGSLLELLDAERQLISVNLEYAQDLADYWTAFFQLEQTIGGGVTS
jgi:outer membrane protein, heavy metal efflux system